MMAAGWLTQAFFILVVIYGQYYLEITFRTLNDFTHISIINVVQQSVGLLSVPIIWFAGFLGLCARSVLMGTIYLWLLWRWRPLRVIPRWNFPNFRHLFRIGIPIFVVGQLDTWWIALNPALILILLGTKSVGIYQPALLTNTAITLLINSVAQVTYPRMVEAYGGGAKLATVLRIPKKSVLYSILLSIPVVVLGWLLMPEIVNFLLPRYSEGILAVQWSLLAALTLSPKPMLNAFNVIKRQDLLAITTILGIAVNGASLLWMGQNGYTVGQFSLAFILGRLVASGSGLLILNHLARKPSY
jgi:O-antigen/teichoic acid export membrane protein